MEFADIDRTVADISKRRPALVKTLETFAPLFSKMAELVPCLAIDCDLDFDQEDSGRPVLEGNDLTCLEAAISKAADALLPLLCTLQPVAKENGRLEEFFKSRQNGASLARAMLEGPGAMAELAEKAGVSAGVLDFVASFVVSTALRALVAKTFSAPAPWEREGVWKEGYCPVCGSMPTIAWLDKKQIDEKNAFLAGGGGKKHLHCSRCGANWTFQRGKCPACGSNGGMEILQAARVPGERLEWCKKCETYCPSIDLREMALVPDMDVMAIGMLHLDMAASQRKLRPLLATFWNTF